MIHYLCRNVLQEELQFTLQKQPQAQIVRIIRLVCKLMVKIYGWMALLRFPKILVYTLLLLLLYRINNVRAVLVSANQCIPSRIKMQIEKCQTTDFPS
jgi:hypothetical protein